MPTTSPTQGLPVPVDGDDPNVPDDFLILAKAIEKKVVGVYATTTERDNKNNPAVTTGSTAPVEGQLAFIKADDSWYVYDGAAWKQIYIGYSYVPQITSGTAAPSGGNNGDVYLQV